MNNLLNIARDSMNEAYTGAISLVDSVGELSNDIATQIGNLPFFASFTEDEMDTGREFDEKHYFLVPYTESSEGFSLFSLRSLPKGVPPINEYPKRRVFHLPTLESEAQLRDLIIKVDKLTVNSNQGRECTMGDGLHSLANNIDKLESNITNGALLIGGLVAIFNPVVGAGIAIMALLPGVGITLGKFGLNSVAEKLNQVDVNRQIKEAESIVLKQFKNSTSIRFVNPTIGLVSRCYESEAFNPYEWMSIQQELADTDKISDISS
jgi:hypothetical protein